MAEQSIKSGVDHSSFIITPFKSGTGFKARCSCGKHLMKATGCNRSGYDYGILGASQAYQSHRLRLQTKDTPNE